MIAVTPEACEWYTPPHILQRVYATLGTVDLDPCCNPGDPVVQARQYYRASDDGLRQKWNGRIFMNPPYDRQINQWTDHLVQDFAAGNVSSAIALVPVKTDTAWWEILLSAAHSWCAVWGRVRLLSPAGVPAGSGTFAAAAVLLSHDPVVSLRFYEEFGDLGQIWMQIGRGAD